MDGRVSWRFQQQNLAGSQLQQSPQVAFYLISRAFDVGGDNGVQRFPTADRGVDDFGCQADVVASHRNAVRFKQVRDKRAGFSVFDQNVVRNVS